MKPLLTASALVLLSACATASAPVTPPATPAATPAPSASAAVSGDVAEGPVCDVVCQGLKVTSLTSNGAAIADAESHTIAETENANQVLDAMRPDLLACYKARVRVMPSAHGTATLSILIGSDGKVRKVETTGGEFLGSAKDCVEKDVMKGEFAPPHGGGTLRIEAPLTFKVQDDEAT
jgi:hypothetical protein